MKLILDNELETDIYYLVESNHKSEDPWTPAMFMEIAKMSKGESKEFVSEQGYKTIITKP